MSDIYTRVTVETRYPDDHGPRIYVAEVPQWDCTVDDMLDLFKSVMLAIGYHPDNLKMLEYEYPTELDDIDEVDYKV